MTPEVLLTKVAIGMSRADVVRVLGQPDHVGGTSRKHKSPSIYKYGDIELWFDKHPDGGLHAIWDERNEVILREREQANKHA